MTDDPFKGTSLVPGRDYAVQPARHKITAVVDEEVYAFLQKREAEGFTLNMVLRRLLFGG